MERTQQKMTIILLTTEQQIKVANIGQYIKAVNFELLKSRKEMQETSNKDFEPQLEYQMGVKKEQTNNNEYELRDCLLITYPE